MSFSSKPRLLTGDTPTGCLHLGHWVGSLENRVLMQEKYDCYFLIANTHAFTTRFNLHHSIRENTLQIVLDYLSVGIDPKKSAIFTESSVSAIYELATWLSMLVPYARLKRNPTIKNEIQEKNLGQLYSMGFLWYPILQVADILAFQAQAVPVGEDQIPHLELTREIARRFNQTYCGIDTHTKDEDHLKAGGIFPIIKYKQGRVQRLVGLGGPNQKGQLLKMSKSLNNAIFLSDTPDIVQQKIMKLYTDPSRIHTSDPGNTVNNPLWIFHDTFNPDKQWVREAKNKYEAGQIGDVACKKKLVEVLVALLSPIQKRRAQYEKDPAYILEVLRQGQQKATSIAEATLQKVKTVIQQIF